MEREERWDRNTMGVGGVMAGGRGGQRGVACQRRCLKECCVMWKSGPDGLFQKGRTNFSMLLHFKDQYISSRH